MRNKETSQSESRSENFRKVVLPVSAAVLTIGAFLAGAIQSTLANKENVPLACKKLRDGEDLSTAEFTKDIIDVLNGRENGQPSFKPAVTVADLTKQCSRKLHTEVNEVAAATSIILASASGMELPASLFISAQQIVEAKDSQKAEK